jgi:coenzyme PQQ precursor peptide PqqA
MTAVMLCENCLQYLCTIGQCKKYLYSIEVSFTKGEGIMKWTIPDFEEIDTKAEVTAYSYQG